MDYKKCATAIRDIEELNIRFGRGVCLLSAVHEAMVYGTVEDKEWRDAVFGAYEYLSDTQEEIRKAVDNCHEQSAAGREVHDYE